MRQINNIVESAFPPNTNSMWLYKGTAKYFSNGKWTTIGSQSNLSKVAYSGDYVDLINTPTIPPAYTLPAASATVIGGVKKGAAVTNVAADADIVAVITQVNSLLASLRNAGIITT